MKLFLTASSLALAASIKSGPLNPTVKLNNGVEMPMVALGVWQYDNATAEDAIQKALSVGFTHIDTAYNYYNQQGVGKALAGKPRDSFFLTTKTPPCEKGTSVEDCHSQTQEQLNYDLSALQMDYVDLVLVHGTSGDRDSACDADACELDYAQWQAYEEFYAQNKTRAIGVSNYCTSCLECLMSKDLKVKPTVNQIQLHVGMGTQPITQNLLKENEKFDIIPQAYSPLGNGMLITDEVLNAMAKKYNVTAAQIALKWIVKQNFPLATKADSTEYLTEDFDLFTWDIKDEDMATLSSKASPSSRPSWSCAN